MLRRLHNSDVITHPDLLIGVGTADDAGVYRLSPDLALVQTVDFFTPIVDDAFDWGRIAAANALSDVYAMGATPLTALSVVGWPRDHLPFDLLGDVLEGAAASLEAAQCTLVGGHSIDDNEPKYGLAVTGVVHPDRVIGNGGAKPGNSLVLTKPIGTGIVATAIKRGEAEAATISAAVEVMADLNRAAAAAMQRIGVTTATDVTGFGLLGHLGEVVRASGVSATVEFAAVPILGGVSDLLARDIVPGGTRRNLAAASRFTHFGELAEPARLLLADAQTNGGLLIAVDGPLTNALLQALEDEGVVGHVIGAVTERRFEDGPTGAITVT